MANYSKKTSDPVRPRDKYRIGSSSPETVQNEIPQRQRQMREIIAAKEISKRTAIAGMYLNVLSNARFNRMADPQHARRRGPPQPFPSQQKNS